MNESSTLDVDMDSDDAPVEPPAGWRRYHCAWAPFDVAYPPGWRVSESPGTSRVFFRPPGEQDAITVYAFDIIRTARGIAFADVTAPLARTLPGLINEYREVDAVRTASVLRIDYTGVLLLPGSGTLYVVQASETICALHFFVPQPIAIRYPAVLETMLASLRVDAPPS